MDFAKVINAIVGEFEAAGIRYALIGGFAMALRGVQRATMDLDFILLSDDVDRADAILSRYHYSRVFRSENVSHYLSADQAWGRIDVLHAFRRPSVGMLQRAEMVRVDQEISLRVVHIEDLVGLKVQAAVNDPTRADNDWHDIKLLLQAARAQGATLDWELVADYLRLFGLSERLAELKKVYGEAH